MTFGSLTRPPATFVDILRDRAEQQGDKAIYTFLRGETAESVSYRELNARARSLASHLIEVCSAGERALLLYPPGLDYIVALYACMYAGVIAVPAYLPRPNRPLSRLEAMLADAQPAISLTTREILHSPRSAFLRQERALAQLRWLATDDVPRAELTESRTRHIVPDAAALLQYTSGSTALPRGVVLSQTNLLHNSEVIKQNFGTSSQSVGVIWLPPYHDMGLIGGILQPLYAGLPVYLLSPTAFLQRPALWLQTISRFRGTCSGGPNFAYDLCVRRVTEEEMEGLDLSSWTVAFTGAEPIREETLEAFAAAFAGCGFSRRSLHPCYGLAEATLMVSGATRGEGPNCLPVSRHALERGCIEPPTPGGDENLVIVSCGRPVGGQELRIVSPEKDVICEAHEIGEVRVAGASVSSGYWQRPEETQATFRAGLIGEEQPFLRTGDLGFIRDGELYITGRIKDLIIIRGQNHYPHDIEFTAEHSHAALKPSSSAAFSVQHEGIECLVIVQEVDARSGSAELLEIVATIRRSVSETHDLRVDEIVPVRPWTIPRTTSGKIQRYLCRAAYLSGTLKPWSDRQISG